jgi:excisionase family DNA binding protein
VSGLDRLYEEYVLRKKEILRRLGPLASVPLLSTVLGVKKSFLYALVRSRKVPAVEVGRRILVDVRALVKFLERADLIPAPQDAGEFPLGECLLRAGLAKRWRGVYIMPKSALSLFQLSGEVLKHVVFVDDDVYRGAPGDKAS